MIKNYVIELEQVNKEINRVSNNLKNLRRQSKEIEQSIISFLNEKEQPGLKYQDKAIIIEKKEKRTQKKKSEIEEEMIHIIEKYGVKNSKDLLDEILESKKGNPKTQLKLKIKNIKKNINCNK